MKIVYSEHLKQRITTRRISYKTPRRIVLTSSEQYFDTATSYSIAVGKLKLDSLSKVVFVAYDIIDQEKFKIITVQFITRAKILARIKTKRWIKKEESI